MNYQAQFCQLKLLLFCLVLLGSCSGLEDRLEKPIKMMAKPVWFDVNDQNYSAMRDDGDTLAHSFFDLAPFGSNNDVSVNFVMLNRKGSRFGYDIDLKTGKKFRRHYFCKQKDIWGKYDDELTTPNFHYGFVPRIIDSLGEPQKIVVYGSEKYLNMSLDENYSQRVRVVGGVIKQFCRVYPCVQRFNWLNSLLLIAVNPQDPKFENVYNFEQLKTKIDWEYSKAFIENSSGLHLTGVQPEPAYRIISDVSAKKALEYTIKNGKLFDFKTQKKLKKNCHLLYDYIWKEHNKVRASIKELDDYYNTKLSQEKKKSQFEKINYNKGQQELEQVESKLRLKELKKESNYALWFYKFHKKYSDEFKTCVEFVKHSSHIHDKKRFWYFTYLEAFMRMEDLNKVYNCSKRNWLYNPFVGKGRRQLPLGIDRTCNMSELNHAFDVAINEFAGMMKSKREHVKFIEFDNRPGGSHERIFGWVKNNGKEIRCIEKEEKEIQEKIAQPVFPSDIRWDDFLLKKNSRESLIIR